MRALVACWRLAGCMLHALHGLGIVLLRFPGLSDEGRRARVGWWATTMLRRLGIALQASGTPKPGAKLLVANHITWLDVIVVNAVCAEARFVAKAEIAHWPIVNRLVSAGGTIYLEREKKRDALRAVHRTAEALTAGGTVAVFPEGTTNLGTELLPFHANLLQAAISTATPIQPLALRYADRDHVVSPAALWPNDVSLVGTVWRLARAQGLVAKIAVLPPMATAHADRRALAAYTRELIGRALDLDGKP